MPHFMIIFTDGKKEPFTKFCDSMAEADSLIMDATCGVGMKAMCYEWDREDEEYKFLFE